MVSVRICLYVRMFHPSHNIVSFQYELQLSTKVLIILFVYPV